MTNRLLDDLTQWHHATDLAIAKEARDAIDRLTRDLADARAEVAGANGDLGFALFASQFDIDEPGVLEACRADYYAKSFDIIRPDFEERARRLTRAAGIEAVKLEAEIERLRAIVRVNGLRWGHTHAEIDAILARQC